MCLYGLVFFRVLTAAFDDGPMTPHDEAPDTPNVPEETERESSTPSSQESWRQP